MANNEKDRLNEVLSGIVALIISRVDLKIHSSACYSGNTIKAILHDIQNELVTEEFPSEKENIEWRLPTTKEKRYLENCTSMDFEVVLGFNTKSYWVYSFENHLLTGWFDSEEAANQWIADRKYLNPETKWAVDFEMDI